MTGFILFGGILALLATAIIWAAIRAAHDSEGVLAPAERRDAAIEALRQLEFEHDTGKVSEDEYLAVRQRLRAEALEARDRALGEPDRGPGRGVSDGGAECPGCGARTVPDERFCSACGHPVAGSG